MSYYCTDPECPNIEPVEHKMNCPICGAKSELVGYLYIQNLIDSKRKARKLNETILFSLSQDAEALSDRLEKLLTELAEHESKKYPKDDADAKTLVLLGKIQSVQTEMLIELQENFIQAVRRLMGI